MIIRDIETGTLWQHATGEALIGPLAGTQLALVGGERTTWTAWCADFPHTALAQEPEKWTGLMPRPIVERVLEKATQSLHAPGLTADDFRLAQNADVAGLVVNRAARAYPLAGLPAGVINDWLGDRPVAVIYDPMTQWVAAFQREAAGEPVTLQKSGRNLESIDGRQRWDHRGRPLAGTRSPLKPLPVTRTRWSGWYEFHPASDIYQRKPNA